MKGIKEILWQLLAPFSVIKPKEKKRKTSGGAVKQHQYCTCNAPEFW